MFRSLECSFLTKVFNVFTNSFWNITKFPLWSLFKCFSFSAADISRKISLSSVQFSRSVMSDFSQPHGQQQARLPCKSPTPAAYSNLCPSSQWRHPTISSSVVPFSFHLHSFQHQGLFKWVSWHQVAKVLEFQLQHQSFQWTPRTDLL